MNSNDMVLFRKALTEAAIQKYTDELAQCDTDDTVSARHTRIMKRILKNAGTVSAGLGKRRSNKKRMVAVLVAAILLLLGGLTVYAKRDAIVTFVEQIFEKFTTVFYQEEPSQEASVPHSIEQAYQPAYIPDGFELQNTNHSLGTYQMQWVNSDGITIVFDQGVIGTNYDMDNEHGSFETLRAGEYDVYCYHGLGDHIFVWSDGFYSYSIHVYCDENAPIRFNEIEKIILSLEKAE